MRKPERPSYAVPLSIEVPLRGKVLGEAGERVITVQSAPMSQLLMAKAAVLPVLEALVEQAPRIFDRTRLEMLTATGDITANDVSDLCALLEQSDVLVDVVAALAPMPRAEVVALLPDEFAYLAACVAWANADFFVQALPMLEAVWQRVAGSDDLAETPLQPGTNSSPVPSTA